MKTGQRVGGGGAGEVERKREDQKSFSSEIHYVFLYNFSKEGGNTGPPSE